MRGSVIMGSACCVAAKDHTIPSTSRTGGESLNRNAVCSPSWSFRWDSWGRVAGEIEDPSFHTSRRVSRNVSMELKGSLSSERGNLSDWGSTLDNSVTPLSLKSPVREHLVTSQMTPSSDLSMSSNCSAVVKNLIESPEIAESSIPNRSVPSVFSIPTTDPMTNHNYHNLPNSTPSRWAHCSPGHPLLTQISDSRILGLKSPDNSISEGRPSFVLSNCSNDMATGSQCGSSDGWSMRTFSEMVAPSQKERWSFDSEYSGSGRHKISGTSSRFSYSPSMDLQSCGACSKLLTERSAWGSQKFIASSDLSVVAVLVCGHVYHAECLETITPEADSYDPACPICMVGEKHMSKLSKKGFRTESETKAKNYKISRNRVVDSYVDGGIDVFDRLKDIVSKMEPSSSSTTSSFGKPFLRRHFSLGSKWSRSLLENDSARKKGFWARYRKD
uniref:RING-type domain-containing protein n=3 Tax=Glycine subgen. Soja TaxID=1462606 RepID=A0A0R0K2Z3_SOYBN